MIDVCIEVYSNVVLQGAQHTIITQKISLSERPHSNTSTRCSSHKELTLFEGPNIDTIHAIVLRVTEL